MNEQPVPTTYFCTPAPSPFPNYLVRTHGDPMTMAETIRQRIHELEPSRSVYGFSTLQDHLDEASSENQLRTILLILFAATAASLACIGLYGTLSYLGRLRQREVGVRLALGALRSQIVARFLLHGMRVAMVGCIVGLASRLCTHSFSNWNALWSEHFGSSYLHRRSRPCSLRHVFGFACPGLASRTH
jgi:putative ABC transport system permease protein